MSISYDMISFYNQYVEVKTKSEHIDSIDHLYGNIFLKSNMIYNASFCSKLLHFTILLQIVRLKRHSTHANRLEECPNLSALQSLSHGRLQHLSESQVRHRPRGRPGRLAGLLLLLLADSQTPGRGPDVVLHLGLERPGVRAHLGGPFLALSCRNYARAWMDPQEVAI